MARQDWFYDLAVLEGPRPRTPSVWGGIQGDIAGQTDLQAALALKSDDATVQAALALKANVAQTVEAFTFTTKQNDLAVASGTTILRWNGAGTTGITGIAAPSTARVVTIVNASTDYLLWLENENTASAAANRLMLPDGFPAFLMPGDTITLFYDLTTARWRVLSWPTRGVQAGMSEFTDYVGVMSPQYAMPFTMGSSGTGSATSMSSNGVNSSQRAAGSAKLSTGTATNGYAYAGMSTSSMRTGLGAYLFAASIAPVIASDGTDTYMIRAGFDEAGSAAFSEAICWEYRWNGSATEWSQTVADNGVVTRSTTGSPSTAVLGAGTRAKLAVFIPQGGTAADFLYSLDSIAWTLASRISSGLPSPSDARLFGPGMQIVKTAGTTNRDACIDWAGYRIQQVRA